MKDILLITKNKTEEGKNIVFKRKNLNIDDFVTTSKGWVYEETFKLKKYTCFFKLYIYNDDPSVILGMNKNGFSTRGYINGFSVNATLDYRKTPFEIREFFGCVELTLLCRNTKLRRRRYGGCNKNSGYTQYTHNNASKPYSGGGMK